MATWLVNHLHARHTRRSSPTTAIPQEHTAFYPDSPASAWLAAALWWRCDNDASPHCHYRSLSAPHHRPATTSWPPLRPLLFTLRRAAGCSGQCRVLKADWAFRWFWTEFCLYCITCSPLLSYLMNIYAHVLEFSVYNYFVVHSNVKVTPLINLKVQPNRTFRFCHKFCSNTIFR